MDTYRCRLESDDGPKMIEVRGTTPPEFFKYAGKEEEEKYELVDVSEGVCIYRKVK